MPPSLYIYIAPLELYSSIPPRCYGLRIAPPISRPPEFPSSTSLQLQRASGAPELHTSTTPHIQLASQSSIPPCPHVCSTAAFLQPLCVHIPPRLHAYIAPLKLHASASPDL